MKSIILDSEKLNHFCSKNHIKKLSLFGSYAAKKNNFNDIDLLVEFDEDKTPGFLKLSRMEIELSELLGGAKVDLRTYRELSRYFREEVVSGAIVQYEK